MRTRHLSRGRIARVLASLSVLVALPGLAACGGGADASGGSDDIPDTIRLAVTDLQGLEELQREFGAFKDALEEAVGTEVELFPVANRTAAAAALAGEQVDFVFTGPAEYVVLRERADVEPVVSVRRDDYRACIYVPADSPVRAPADLRGRTVGMSDIGSTSGHLGPSQLLVDAGVAPREELEVVTVGDAVHAALERGDVDAVGVGCHDRDEYVEGVEDEYRTVVEGDALPPDVIVAAPEVSDATVTALRDGFRDNWPVLLEAMLEGKDNAKYAGAELVETTDRDYDVVRSMYAAIGVPDTSRFLGD